MNSNFSFNVFRDGSKIGEWIIRLPAHAENARHRVIDFKTQNLGIIETVRNQIIWKKEANVARAHQNRLTRDQGKPQATSGKSVI